MSKPLQIIYQIKDQVVRMDLPIQFNAQDDTLHTETIDINLSEDEEENGVLKIDLDNYKHAGEIETIEIVGLNFHSSEPSVEPVRFEVMREIPKDLKQICDEIFEDENSQETSEISGLKITNVESLHRDSGLVISNVVSKSQESHTCRICGNILSSRSKTQEHLQTFHKIFCQQTMSGMFFDSKIGHRKLTHPKKEYNCDLCGRTFKWKTTLQKHIKSHQDIIECGICEKKLRKSKFDEHLKKHTSSAMTMSCHFCNMAFKSMISLAKHLESHTRSFDCEQCDKKFTKKCHLKEHLIWHENPNAFTCEHCGEKFELRCSLQSHVIYNHSRDVVKLNCSKCPYSTEDMERFLKHGERHAILEERKIKRMELDRAKQNWLRCSKCSALLKNKLKLASHYWKKHKEAMTE